MIEIENEYFSASSNRSTHSIDLFDNLLIYGSSNSIIIYDLENFVVLDKLDGHEKQVNCVKFFNKGKKIISCSADKNAIIWHQSNKNKFFVQYILRGHLDSLTVSASLELDNNKISSLTCCNDCSIGIWVNDKNLSYNKYRFHTFDIKLFQIEKLFFSKILVLLATSDNNSYLYSLNNEIDLIFIIKLSTHNDWVRSIDFIVNNQDTMIVSSGSNDGFIRILKIKKVDKTKDKFNINNSFKLNKSVFIILLDSVIPAHDDKIFCVKWVPKNCGDKLKLLSCSLDKTMIMWEQSKENECETWVEKYRFGELSGNNLSFLSCTISQDALNIVVNSFNGAFHYWQYQNQLLNWKPSPIISGHFATVTDIQWDVKNNYLISVSLDETCRIHAVCQINKNNVWLEVSRPQVHGYELNCVAPILSTKFVSGADEKVLRIFQATYSFINNFKNITKYEIEYNKDENLSDYAIVPNLGLSNQPVFKNQIDKQKLFVPVILESPPKEETLLNNTLWVEIQKIYGHGYEIYTVAVNYKKNLIASACKATNIEDAAVCLWNIDKDYTLTQRLLFHKLTITSIKFSPNGQFLVTVSRDRNWCLYKFNENESLYQLFTYSNKEHFTHSRIIWDVCWTFDNEYFITTSRDTQIVFWKLNLNEKKVNNSNLILKCKQSAYGVDVAKKSLNSKYIVACGLENGTLIISLWDSCNGWKLFYELNKFHTISIKKVRFNSDNRLATCGEDGFIRILKLII